MSVSSIEWTDRTWNPVRGCTRVSEGCRNCYAEAFAARNMPGHRSPTTGEPFAVRTPAGPRWTGKVELIPSKLDEPLRWRKPQRVFVNSMSDLFHEALPDEAIAAVFGGMAAAPQHTFQILTKRADRLPRWFEWLERDRDANRFRHPEIIEHAAATARDVGATKAEGRLCAAANRAAGRNVWPLPNVWLGVSVEDQKTADDRIPLLLQTPAAVRFVSYEPALGPVSFTPWLYVPTRCRACGVADDAHYDPNPKDLPNDPLRPHGCVLGAPNTGEPGAVRCNACGSLNVDELAPLDWIIVGGESGPGARPFDVAWARSTVEQCRAAGVAVFVKQLGARPFDSVNRKVASADGEPLRTEPWNLSLKSKKGGDPAEWPADLRVREFPGGSR